MKDKKDNILTGAALTFDDVSGERRAAEAIKYSEAKFKAIFEQSPLGIAMVDSLKGDYIDVNMKFIEIMGRTREELLHTNWMTVTHPEDLEESKSFSKLLDCGKINGYNLQKRFLRPDDSLIWVNMTITKIIDYKLAPWHICIIEDITKAKQIENEFKEQEMRFHSLFDNMTNGVMIFEVLNEGASAKDYIIKDINRAGLQMENKVKEEVLGKNAYDIRPNTDTYGLTELYQKVWQTGRPLYFPEKIYVDEKYNNWYEHMVFRLESGEIVNIYNDVTEKIRMDEKLMDSEKKFRHAIENAPIPIMIYTEDGEVIAVNNIWAKITGYELSDIPQINIWQSKVYKNKDDEEITDITLSDLSNPSFDGEYSVLTKDDEIRIWNFYSSFIGKIDERKMIMSAAIDITNQKITHKEYQMVLENSIDGFFMTDINGRFLNANNAYCQMIGYSRSDLLNMTIYDITVDTEKQKISSDWGKIIKKGFASFETQHICKNGNIIDIEESIGYMSENCCLYVFLRDITERKKREKEILYLNYHDILTGLYNRAFLDEQLKRMEKNYNLPVSVIMGDINGLKLVNDGFGHFVGDNMLIEMAEILKGAVRKEDIVARYGGDEFFILMPGVGENEIQEVCRHIYKQCEDYDNKSVAETGYLSISLGYATRTNACKSIYSVIKEAESFMYRRKLLDSKSMHSSLITSIKSTMFEKSHETEEHAERMAILSKRLGEKLHLSEREMADLELFAALHDIGKMSIEDNILNKAGRLTEEEWYEIKRHPEVGYRIAMTSPDINHIANLILTHHEHWDGSGYPQGLKGEEIPLLSRILAIVDTFDAMTADRPYRKAMPKGAAVEEIIRSSGSQFDPEITKLFIETIEEDSYKDAG